MAASGAASSRPRQRIRAPIQPGRERSSTESGGWAAPTPTQKLAVSPDSKSGLPLQPNKRLKLAAPGLGRIAFVRQHTSCSFVNAGAPAAWGAAA